MATGVLFYGEAHRAARRTRVLPRYGAAALAWGVAATLSTALFVAMTPPCE